MHKNILRRFSASSLLQCIRSKTFFKIFLGFFVFESLWIALSGAYSMSFDEYFHYGIIKLYSHQWLPFIGHQPSSVDQFGAVTRDPSYLYHYLMSFPYRIFAHFFHAYTAQIIMLRLWDILFFTLGIIVFRRLFKVIGVSSLASNITLLFLTLLPVSSFVAAQVNYDDLLFLMTGLTLLSCVKLVEAIRDKDHIPVVQLLLVAALAMLTSIEKYAFLPILLGIALYLLLSIYREVGLHRLKLWSAIKRGTHGLRSRTGILIMIVFIISLGLFVERYGYNTIKYHNPVPECDQVLNTQRCNSYDPFARNYAYKQTGNKPSKKDKNNFALTWVRGMMRSLFFVVNNKQSNYTPGEPLAVAIITGYTIGAVGMILVLWNLKRLWQTSHAYQLFLVLIVVYIVTLYLQNIKFFLDFDVAVAIQGRYLLPVMPLILILVAQSSSFTLSRVATKYKAAVLILFLFCMFEGGGIVPFIVRSDPTWLWNSPVVNTLNQGARDILKPIEIGA